MIITLSISGVYATTCHLILAMFHSDINPKRLGVRIYACLRHMNDTKAHSKGIKKPAGPFGTLPVLEIWWRRGELNPRPQVLRLKVYMLISLFNLANDYPSSQENHQRFRKVLAHPHRTDFSAILCNMTSESVSYTHLRAH